MRLYKKKAFKAFEIILCKTLTSIRHNIKIRKSVLKVFLMSRNTNSALENLYRKNAY